MRYKLLKVSPILILNFCQVKEVHFLITNHLIPKSARVVRTYVDADGLIVMIVQDESFDKVESLFEIPEIPTPTFETV